VLPAVTLFGFGGTALGSTRSEAGGPGLNPLLLIFADLSDLWSFVRLPAL